MPGGVRRLGRDEQVGESIPKSGRLKPTTKLKCSGDPFFYAICCWPSFLIPLSEIRFIRTNITVGAEACEILND
jgi:hypothetical protein